MTLLLWPRGRNSSGSQIKSSNHNGGWNGGLQVKKTQRTKVLIISVDPSNWIYVGRHFSGLYFDGLLIKHKISDLFFFNWFEKKLSYFNVHWQTFSFSHHQLNSQFFSVRLFAQFYIMNYWPCFTPKFFFKWNFTICLSHNYTSKCAYKSKLLQDNLNGFFLHNTHLKNKLTNFVGFLFSHKHNKDWFGIQIFY